MRTRHPYQRPAHRQGFTLIEVLVAMLVVALGMLVMIVMQVNATKLTKTSELRTMGAMLAADLADRMRANPDGAKNHSYRFTTAYPSPYPTAPNFDVTPTCTQTTYACSPAEIAAADMALWRTTVSSALPNGWVRVDDFDTHGNAVELWLIWKEFDEHSGAQSPILDPCPSGSVTVATTDTTTAMRCMYFRVNL